MTDPHGEPHPNEDAPPPDSATPPPPRRRTRALVVGAVSATPLIGGAVATVGILATRHRSTPAAAKVDASGSAVPAPIQTTAAPPSPSASPERAEFTFPQQIGPLSRKTGPEDESVRQDLTRIGVIRAFAEKYEDAKGCTVQLYGGNGRDTAYADKDADQVLDDIVKIVTDPAKDRTVGASRHVPPGGAGGTLSCVPMKNVGTVCGWKLNNLYVEAVMLAWQPDPGGQLMRTILDAIVLPA
jgi:hypothetical protein